MVRIVKRSAKLDGDLSVNSTLMYHAAPKITFDLEYLFSILTVFCTSCHMQETQSQQSEFMVDRLKPFCAATVFQNWKDTELCFWFGSCGSLTQHVLESTCISVELIESAMNGMALGWDRRPLRQMCERNMFL